MYSTKLDDLRGDLIRSIIVDERLLSDMMSVLSEEKKHNIQAVCEFVLKKLTFSYFKLEHFMHRDIPQVVVV